MPTRAETILALSDDRCAALQATIRALVTAGFSFDDEPTVNSQGELAVATSGSHNLRRRSNGSMKFGDVGVGLALAGVPHGERGTRDGSRSQRISDCGLFSHVDPQFKAPATRQKFTFLPRRTRGQEGADRGYQLPGVPQGECGTKGAASRPPTANGLADIGVHVVPFAPEGARAGWGPIFPRRENIGTGCVMGYDLPPVG